MHVRRTAVVAAVAGLFGGCDANHNPNSPGSGLAFSPVSTIQNPNSPGSGIGFSPVLERASSCSPLTGNFRSTSLRLTGLEPGLFRDFGASGADLVLFFSDDLFTLNFLQPGLSGLNQGGFFATTGDLLTLGLAGQPLLPGAFPGDQRFDCRLFDNRLFLTTNLLFDFKGTGFVMSRFEGEFRRF